MSILTNKSSLVIQEPSKPLPDTKPYLFSDPVNVSPKMTIKGISGHIIEYLDGTPPNSKRSSNRIKFISDKELEGRLTSMMEMDMSTMLRSLDYGFVVRSESWDENLYCLLISGSVVWYYPKTDSCLEVLFFANFGRNDLKSTDFYIAGHINDQDWSRFKDTPLDSIPEVTAYYPSR